MELKNLEECPTIQIISKFVDGLIVGEEKKILIAHFDACPICYETLTNTLDTQEEFPNLFEQNKSADILKFKPTRTHRILDKLKSTQKKIAIVVAASVIGIVGYQTLKPQFMLKGFPSPYSVANVINKEVKSLPDRPQRIVFRGLADTKPNLKREREFFHLGRRLTHIEINLHQNNRNKLEEDLEILEEMELVSQIRKPIEKFSNEIRFLISSEKNLSTDTGITDALIAEINDSPEINHLRLGSWLEGMKIGLGSEPPTIPEIEAPELFIDQFIEEKTNSKIIEQLKKLNNQLINIDKTYNAPALLYSVNSLFELY